MLNILTNLPYFKKTAVKGIIGSVNGTFALKTEDNRLHLHTADGTYLKSIVAADARLLNDNSCFVYEPPLTNSLYANSFLQTQLVWNLYAPDGKLMLQDCKVCELYANGWYRIVKNDKHYLYDDKHNLMACGFKQCAVFKNGYALRTNEVYYQFADWQIFSPDKTQIGYYRNVGALLGDGLFLTYHFVPTPNGKHKNYGKLYEPETDELIASNICNAKTFPNGKFVLTFADKDFGLSAKMYAPNGQRISTAASEAEFLPDGRFIQFHNNRISAVYRANGLFSTDEVWNYELAGNYYLLGYNGVDTLYNDKGEDLGENYGLLGFEENIALFENEQAYHLFNQNGHVLSLDYPD